jgi:UDP-3-O-[3-hydroxymyristoyl] N-acetylglucosamine deacetylase
VIARAHGPIVIAQRGVEAKVASLSIARADRGVLVASSDGRVRVDLVEHLFAAIGGLSVIDGVRVTADDGEIPLLDGSSARFVEAIVAIDPPRGHRLRVTREASFEHGRSRYRFAPSDRVRVDVEVDFPAPVGRQRASWDGDAADFTSRIAPARTFGWRHEVDAMRRAGRAAEVDLASVLVFDGDRVMEGCEAREADEPVRHKLLDLLGDLAIHGGPPVGSIEAFAPGHSATHAVVSQALALGVIAEIDP